MDSTHYDTVKLNVSEGRIKEGVVNLWLKVCANSSTNKYMGPIAEKSKHPSRSCSSFPELRVRRSVSGLGGRC